MTMPGYQKAQTYVPDYVKEWYEGQAIGKVLSESSIYEAVITRGMEEIKFAQNDIGTIFTSNELWLIQAAIREKKLWGLRDKKIADIVQRFVNDEVKAIPDLRGEYKCAKVNYGALKDFGFESFDKIDDFVEKLSRMSHWMDIALAIWAMRDLLMANPKIEDEAGWLTG